MQPIPYPPAIDQNKETQAIVQFLQTTFTNTGFTTAIIALSGGIDSATSTLLAAKALGPENVHVLLLPARQTDPVHLKDSQELAQAAHIPTANIHQINIASIIQKTWRIIKHYETNSKIVDSADDSQLARAARPRSQRSAGNRESSTHNWERRTIEDLSVNRLRLANIAARTRMVVLYDQAKKLNALVIGTENRSEHLLGYFTRFGDEASDIEPIKHLYKSQVRELALYLKAPQSIIDKAPTAGLWAGQTDETELGFSYAEADPILYLAYDQNLPADEIYNQYPNLSKKLIKKVLNTTYKNLFKHQVPYSIGA